MRKTLLTCYSEAIRDCAQMRCYKHPDSRTDYYPPTPHLYRRLSKTRRTTRYSAHQQHYKSEKANVICLKKQERLSLSSALDINARGSVTDKCPDCLEHLHTTNYLFECPANPTHFTLRAPWEQPTYVAAHYRLVTGRANAEKKRRRANTTTTTIKRPNFPSYVQIQYTMYRVDQKS